MMLRQDMAGAALRAVERRLMRRCRLLVVSSPAFIEHYFRPRQKLGEDLRLPVLLVENKLLELENEPARARRPAGRTRPWRIGWLGAIRCRRSLDILTGLAAKRPDLLEVHIHGRPAYSEFDDFDAQVASAPGVTFGGAYAAADLPRLYAAVDFSWAIDFMEEGQNSAWLLPNRIYEGSRFGVAPIALDGVETGRFLRTLDFGLRLDSVEDLERVLEAMTPARLAELHRLQDRIPLSAFIVDRRGCRELVEALAGGTEAKVAPLAHEDLPAYLGSAGVEANSW